MKSVDVHDLITIAKIAGEAILKVYEKPFCVSNKADNSPVTKADTNANAIICRELSKYGYPIISEEILLLNYNERKNWSDFFIVDPLDGTKEFISKNGNFTVNIAFLKNCKPFLGVIYAPVSKVAYYTDGFKAYKNGKTISWSKSDTLRVVMSQNHSNNDTKDFVRDLGEVHTISIGSSLKFCLIAEGKADIYPRLSTTCEWDTAAAHAILKAIGKNIYVYGCEEELKYNKESLLNPWFIAK